MRSRAIYWAAGCCKRCKLVLGGMTATVSARCALTPQGATLECSPAPARTTRRSQLPRASSRACAVPPVAPAPLPRQTPSAAQTAPLAPPRATAASRVMGMPIRIFDSDSDDSSPQRKRRRSSNGAAVPGSATESVVDVSDSDEEVATDSAPDLSMHEVIRRMRSVSQVTRRRLASTRNHLNNETHLPLPLDPVRNAPRSSTATRNPAGRVLTLMQTMPRTLRANIERSARPARADTPAPYDRLNAASEVSLLE
eukprot:IDg16080t1